jgi:hypothetical protein
MVVLVSIDDIGVSISTTAPLPDERYGNLHVGK